MSEEKISHIVDYNGLPKNFPTHSHDPAFWESLGRAVATFGFLEEVLCKAIFAFTATKPYSDSEIIEAYENWLPKLQRALTDQLWNLIEAYGKAVNEHPDAKIENLTELLEDLKSASKIRNVLCHGSWRTPDQNKASMPFFVNKKNEIFDTPLNKAWLDHTQQDTTKLICAIISTVTYMGWQFPGSISPGTPIWQKS